MQATRRGPQFERSEDQQVVVGGYESPTRPGPATPGPSRKPTLLGKLQARFRGQKAREHGPGFRQPEDAARIGKYRGRRRNRSAGQPRRRPTGFETTDE